MLFWNLSKHFQDCLVSRLEKDRRNNFQKEPRKQVNKMIFWVVVVTILHRAKDNKRYSFNKFIAWRWNMLPGNHGSCSVFFLCPRWVMLCCPHNTTTSIIDLKIWRFLWVSLICLESWLQLSLGLTSNGLKEMISLVNSVSMPNLKSLYECKTYTIADCHFFCFQVIVHIIINSSYT